MSEKEAEEKIHAVLNTSRTSSARSIFLAGFSYLRIRLYGSAADEDTTFIVFYSLTFNLALISAVLSLVFIFCLGLCSTIAEQLRFAERANVYFTRGSYRCFLLALLCYCVANSRTGFSYFQDSTYKYAPFVIFLLTALALLHSTIQVVAKALAIENDKENRVSIDQLRLERSGDPLDVFMSKQMAVMSERAIYIAGFAVNGLGFYQNSYDEDWHGLDKVYLIFCCISVACCLYVTGTLSSLNIFLLDTPSKDGRRLRFANETYRICELCLVVYILSFLSIGVAITFAGYGNNYQQDKTVCCIIGGTGIIVLLLVFVKTLKSHGAASAIATNKDDDVLVRESVSIALQGSAKIGAVATITSGFVFNNILFYGNFAGDARHGLAAAYLGASCLSVVLCLFIAITDSVLQLFANDLNTFSQRSFFLEKMSPVTHFCQIGSITAVAAMLVSYALVGFVRFDPYSYEPMYASILAGVLILGGFYFIRTSFFAVEGILSKFEASEGAAASQSTTALMDPRLATRVMKRPMQISLFAGCALFFGGYGYNSVINLGFSRTKIDISFVCVMSLVFLCSITVTVWAAYYVFCFLKCPSNKEKFVFAMRTGPLYNTGIGTSLAAVVSITVGFSLLGYTKTSTDNYQSFAGTLITATVIGVLLVLGIIYSVVQIYFRDVLGQEKESAEREDSATTRPSAVAEKQKMFGDYAIRFTNQITAGTVISSFIGGNLFYELLFMKPIFRQNAQWVTYLYFFLTGSTFVSAVSVVVLSNFTIFFVNSLPSDESAMFCYHLFKGDINWYIFYFSTSALFTWIGSGALLPHVTYLQDSGQRWPMTVLCTLSLTVLMHGLTIAFKHLKASTLEAAGADIVLSPLSPRGSSAVSESK